MSGNSADSEGGGISNKANGSFTNLTLAGNTAVSGGGLLHNVGTATVTNTTIANNRVTTGAASIFGGGVYAATPMTLFNTIVATNVRGASPSTVADDVAGTLNSNLSAYNLIGGGGAGGLTNGTNNNQVTTGFIGLGTLANNGGPTQTIALLPGSPAFNQGSNNFVALGATDQRGFSRVVNTTVDIGAFEVDTDANAARESKCNSGCR